MSKVDLNKEEEKNKANKNIYDKKSDKKNKKKDKNKNDHKIEALKEELENLTDSKLRLQAEFDNFRKRNSEERIKLIKTANAELVNEILPAVDNLERALQLEETKDNKGVLEGVKMTHKLLLNALKDNQVEEIVCEGVYDPNVHHPVVVEKHENLKTGEIIETLQKGYKIDDKIIRVAMVKVAE